MEFLQPNIINVGCSIVGGMYTAYTYNENVRLWTRKLKLKSQMYDVFRQSKLQTERKKLPNILKVDINEYGFSMDIDTKGACSYSEIKNISDYIKCCFHAIDIDSYFYKITHVDVLLNKCRDINYSYQNMNPYTLLCGYTPIGEPITINMKKTPHIGVVGTSTSGKSKCVELMLTNLRNADITLVNAFEDDFENIKCNRVNGNKQIVEFLKHNTNCKYKLPRPHYIVIDEYNVLNNIKGIDKIIQDLLSQARHFNIYVICIMQIGNKEDCRFKNLFNTRIAFRTLEQQTLSAFLGISETLPLLPDREFYMTSTKLFKGKTYNLFL